MAAFIPFATVGPEGVGAAAEIGNLLASTVMNCVADPVMEDVAPIGAVVFALNVPAVMAICTSCDAAGGAFWCGFHSDGINQASNGYVVTPLLVTDVQ